MPMHIHASPAIRIVRLSKRVASHPHTKTKPIFMMEKPMSPQNTICAEACWFMPCR